MCLSEPDNNRACLFDTDNVWTILHYKYKYKHNEYKYKYNTIHIYSYIHIFVRIVFQIKRLFWSGLQIFQSIFSQFSEVYVFFRIFDIFQIFNFLHNYFYKFFGVFFRMVRQDIFSNLPKFFFPNSGGVFLWILSIYPNFSEYFFPNSFWPSRHYRVTPKQSCKTCKPCKPVGANFFWPVLIFWKITQKLCYLLCPWLISLTS